MGVSSQNPLATQFPLTFLTNETPPRLIPIKEDASGYHSSPIINQRRNPIAHEGLRTHLVVFGLVYSTGWVHLVKGMAVRAAAWQREREEKVSRNTARCPGLASHGTASSYNDRPRVRVRVTAINFDVIKVDVPMAGVAEAAAAFLQSCASSVGLDLAYSAVQVRNDYLRQNESKP